MDRNLISQRVFFLIIFLLLIVMAFLILKPFMSTIVLALTFIIVLKPLYSWILSLGWIKGRSRLSASLTLLLVIVLIIVPLYFLGRVLVSQISTLLATIDLSGIEALNLDENVKTWVSGAQSTVQSTTTEALDEISNIGSSLMQLFVDAIIFVVIFVTLMPEFDNTVTQVEDISPLGKEISTLYYTKTTAMVSSMFKGIFIIAILQGLIMGFFYWLAGLNLWFLFMIISMFLAVIPIVGISWLVLLLSAISIIQGDVSAAITMLIGFYGVANWVDVLLRPKLVSKEAYMNFALVLLGILGGVTWAGFLGLFYGPVIMLLLVTTIKIYGERYAKDDVDVIQDYLSQEGDSKQSDLA